MLNEDWIGDDDADPEEVRKEKKLMCCLKKSGIVAAHLLITISP